jgi:hypothetical protein
MLLYDEDGVSNPRTLFGNYVSSSLTRTVPEANWELLYNQVLSSSSTTSPSPGAAPHYIRNALNWQVDEKIVTCGGGEPAISSDCAVWNEGFLEWTWFGVGSFSPRVSGAATFVERRRNRLWLYGGKTDNVISDVFWYATYDPASNEIISSWQNMTFAGGPGPRAWAAFWQVRRTA